MKCQTCNHDSMHVEQLGFMDEFPDKYNPVFLDQKTGKYICQRCYDASMDSLLEFEDKDEEELDEEQS